MPEVKTETAAAATAATPSPAPAPRPDSFSLAHVSDLHLTTLAHATIPQLLGKRLLGYSSWRRKRRIVHSLAVVEALLADLRLTRPDHVAVTGDLTHLGLPREFAEAGQWLPSLGGPERVTVIPGNHEAYAGSAWIRACAQWAPYLASDVHREFAATAGFFPSLRIRGGVALIGLCSARPSLPFLAVGSLGRSQLDGLAALLRQTRPAGLFRIVLIHHPPVPGAIKWRKRLTDAGAFREVIARHGAELVLHGHTHMPTLSGLSTPAGEVPVIGAPSASELNPSAGRCARYHIYDLHRNGPDWQVTMRVRAYSQAAGRFVAGEEIPLGIPRHAPADRRLDSSGG